MDAKHWGKAFWTTLFSVALSYPEEPDLTDQVYYKSFYHNLQYILPCATCRKHFQKCMREMPINPFLSKGRKGIFNWLMEMHNRVNRDNAMPELSKEEIMIKYFPNMSSAERAEYIQIGGASNTTDNVATAATTDTSKLNNLLFMAAVAGAGYYFLGK